MQKLIYNMTFGGEIKQESHFLDEKYQEILIFKETQEISLFGGTPTLINRASLVAQIVKNLLAMQET